MRLWPLSCRPSLQKKLSAKGLSQKRVLVFYSKQDFFFPSGTVSARQLPFQASRRKQMCGDRWSGQLVHRTHALAHLAVGADVTDVGVATALKFVA